ncbi:MAG: class I SAM-dependent methyltransferase [Candidatus Paceibacterota bacterium]|jgi:SAM-dependent methyltransferase
MENPNTKILNNDRVYAKWNNVYYELTKNKEIDYQIKEVVDFVKEKDNALDLGAGALVESKFLLEKGFKNVVAVDLYDVRKYTSVEFPEDKNFNYIIQDFESFDFKENYYDLIIANNSLTFTTSGELENLLSKIQKSLKQEGVFFGDLFDNSSSNFREGFSFVDSIEEVKEKLLKSNFKLIDLKKEIGETEIKKQKIISYKFICKKD